MSPMTRARCAPRTTALVWWSISAIVTRTVDLVAEQHLAERIADEDERDAGLVEELGGRVVVGGQHRQPLAVGVAPGDVGDGQATRVVVGLGAHVSVQSARRRRGRPARAATRSSMASATSRLVSSGRSSRPPSAARMRHPVGVGPEARAGLGDVVGDEQVDALAAELVRGPVERAGLRGEADEDRAAADRP